MLLFSCVLLWAAGAQAGTPTDAATGEPPLAGAAAGESGSLAEPADGNEAAAELPIDDVLEGLESPLDDIESQIRAHEYRAPLVWLETEIDRLEAAHHSYAPELIRPLTLLGDAQVGLGNYEGALENYQRAVHLSRVDAGLNSVEQVNIVYREANAYKALGDLREANNREEYAYHVLTQVYQPYDERLLPGVFHLAEWYSQTHNIFSARALYEHAVAILSANGKDTTELAIPALQGIARTYRLERFPPYYIASSSDSGSDNDFSPAGFDSAVSVNNFPAGERALQQIVQIRQAEAEAEPIAEVEAILDLADWYLLFDKTRRAFPLYEFAYEKLAELESVDVAGYFGEPKLLYFPLPKNPKPPPVTLRGDRRDGYVELSYDVSQTGHIRGLKTVASEPPGLMDFRVRKSMRLARYRPAIVDGVPLPKAAHSYRYEFAYYPSAEAEAEEAAIDAREVLDAERGAGGDG